LQVKAKEQRTLEEKETGFADQGKRQKLIASLPSTFDIITPDLSIKAMVCNDKAGVDSQDNYKKP
jgi:hypothetical protein